MYSLGFRLWVWWAFVSGFGGLVQGFPTGLHRSFTRGVVGFVGFLVHGVRGYGLDRVL